MATTKICAFKGYTIEELNSLLKNAMNFRTTTQQTGRAVMGFKRSIQAHFPPPDSAMNEILLPKPGQIWQVRGTPHLILTKKASKHLLEVWLIHHTRQFFNPIDEYQLTKNSFVELWNSFPCHINLLDIYITTLPKHVLKEIFHTARNLPGTTEPDTFPIPKKKRIPANQISILKEFRHLEKTTALAISTSL